MDIGDFHTRTFTGNILHAPKDREVKGGRHRVTLLSNLLAPAVGNAPE